MTIEEHARDREAAWLAAHPDGHEYAGKDLLMEAMEELADCWNYIGASWLPPAVIEENREMLANIYLDIQMRRAIRRIDAELGPGVLASMLDKPPSIVDNGDDHSR